MTLEDFEKFIESIKEKPIYNVSQPKYKSNKIFEFGFDIGNPQLKTDLRHSGDHGFGHLKKYIKMIDQEYFVMSMENEIRLSIFGCWELKYNGKTLIDNKTDEDNTEELFNFIFQGHKINEIKISDEKIIIILSNKMELNITKENENDGLLVFRYDNNIFGLSNDEGIIGKVKTEKKFSKWINYMLSDK